MELNDLLRGKTFDPTKTLVLRHRPTEPDLQKVLPLLAADRPELFNAYQQTQGETLENAMLKATHIVSCIGHEPRKALYVGLYKIGKTKPLTREQYHRVPEYIELKSLGHMGFNDTEPRSCLWFDLVLDPFYREWKGKLILDWPPPERSWWRRAERNVISVSAILEDSALDTAMKRWDEIDFSWSQLAILPKRWQAKLAEWRGIYYIFDTSDQKGYVGSAYGPDNLLGRWRNYSVTGHGGNRLLRQRAPENFRFTILELVAPSTEATEVVQLENSWKERLHTRQPHGLNDN